LREELKNAFNLKQKNTEKPKNNIEKFWLFFKTIANSSQVLRSNSAEPTIVDHR